MSYSAPETSRQWQFNPKLIVFGLVMFPILISLGIWQLQRAAEKEQALDQFEALSDPVSLSELSPRSMTVGQLVAVQGRYTKESWLLDNRTRDGAPGYEVLTRMTTPSGQHVVVNRGWVPAARSRDELPDIDSPEGLVFVEGRLSPYPSPPVLSEPASLPEGWPRRVQQLTQESVQAQTSMRFPPLLVRLANDRQPGAYRADWALDEMGPQTHYGYAFQWFSMAAALVILTLLASYQRKKANNDNHNG